MSRWRRVLWLGGLLLVGQWGCASDPEPLPTIADLRAHETDGQREVPSDLVVAQPGRSSRQQELLVDGRLYRIDVPVDTSTDGAWQIVQTDMLDATRQEAWRLNGMRVGVLPAASEQAFAFALPARVGRSEQRVVSLGDFVQMVWTEPLEQGAQGGRLPICLWPEQVGEDGRVQPGRWVTLEEGRLRLLFRMLPAGDGTVIVELWPHQQDQTGGARLQVGAAGGVRLMTPEERAMLGWMMEDLVIQVRLGPGAGLVVGLDRDWPEVVPMGAVDSATIWPVSVKALGATSSVAYETNYDADLRPLFPPVEPEPLRPGLGQAWMTGDQDGLAVQRVFVLIPSP